MKNNQLMRLRRSDQYGVREGIKTNRKTRKLYVLENKGGLYLTVNSQNCGCHVRESEANNWPRVWVHASAKNSFKTVGWRLLI